MLQDQIKDFLLHYFTWWNGANFNTRFYTRRFGVLVGHDEFGNAYYRRPGIDPALGFERRWVIYNGVSEASTTPPGWNGWLHHTVDVPPTEDDYKPHPWQKPHMGNPTGTPAAIRPDGSTLRPGPRQATGGDYEAWSPGP
jgi:NADH:ubiquinone oxidoreductase subunit